MIKAMGKRGHIGQEIASGKAFQSEPLDISELGRTTDRIGGLYRMLASRDPMLSGLTD